ncbi:MAG: Hsp20/alpha crystallin family protein [Phycisphaerae bacterium]|jgi:HSP20 family protein|nr:Hsp20/alpha crystallin family protein [Phycisphaerae bacterium]MCZ2399524.1 Hsp20/alpha crystallin family protein [Phycisphaerae bacterium]NUQ49634.1 Hsp20/alpha crystallin family protein [Phycisphaerae bacterium]
MNIIPWRRNREDNEGPVATESPLARLRHEMDTMFDRFLRNPWGLTPLESSLGRLTALPRTDLAETDTQVIVTMDVPGVDPKEVRIELEGDTLTVRGEKRSQKEEKRRDYHYMERQSGSFMRRIQLPSTVDPDKVEATHKNGVLTITIAKHPGATPKRIKLREG